MRSKPDADARRDTPHRVRWRRTREETFAAGEPAEVIERISFTLRTLSHSPDFTLARSYAGDQIGGSTAVFSAVDAMQPLP